MPGRSCHHGARHDEATVATALLIDNVQLNHTVECNMARYESFATISVDACLELKAQGLILCHASMTPSGVNRDNARADDINNIHPDGGEGCSLRST